MRCPACAGEVLAGSRFCGICGRTLANAGAVAGVGAPAAAGLAGAGGGAAGVSVGAAAIDAGSMSLFELPVSRGARAARVALVLALDALLAGAGVYLILAYLDARAAVPVAPAAPPPPELRATIEADRPVVVPPEPPPPGPTTPSTPSPTSPSPSPQPQPRPQPQPTTPSPQEPPQPQPQPTPQPAATDAGPVSEPPIEAPPASASDAGAATTPAAAPDEAEAGNLADALALVVASHDAQLQRCYERAAKTTSTAEPLEGTIVLHFTLVPGGRLERVSAESNETGSPQLAACVVALAEGWTVAPGPTAPLAFEWPFRFRAGGVR